MGETTNQIERHIEATRHDLSYNFSELEEKVKSAVDWRTQLEERPGTVLALAFGGGVLLSALLPSVGSSRKSSSSRWTGPTERETREASSTGRSAFGLTKSHTLRTWDALTGALLGVASTKLGGFIEDLLPGFKEEFTKAQNKLKS
ncbi:MAG: hypothetical protein GZ088_11000 [Acidipila sp.]|nr:hypothetical protein [Acidipila sp.]